MDTPNLDSITAKNQAAAGSISNNYQFDAMLRAIDFFSQKFNLDMLIDFAGDFVNEILTLGASALFVFDEKYNAFIVTKTRLYDTGVKLVANNDHLQRIATMYGTIITDKFDQFFPPEFMEGYRPKLIVPLIHNNALMGFIVSDGKAIGDFDEDDYSMAKAMMHLFNDAFERNHYILELSANEKKLDNKIFELNTVNKASKILFSEIELDKLLTVAVEMFSEVSGSLVTAFGIRTIAKDAVETKVFSDVRTQSPCPDHSVVYFNEPSEIQNDKYTYHVDNDHEVLQQIFKNPEEFSRLGAEYVVLIVKDKRILGFATLGKSKKYDEYTPDVLELVTSLAISCFIALNNAMIFKDLVAQKQDLETKYNDLLDNGK